MKDYNNIIPLISQRVQLVIYSPKQTRNKWLNSIRHVCRTFSIREAEIKFSHSLSFCQYLPLEFFIFMEMHQVPPFLLPEPRVLDAFVLRSRKTLGNFLKSLQSSFQGRYKEGYFFIFEDRESQKREDFNKGEYDFILIPSLYLLTIDQYWLPFFSLWP